MHLPQAHKCSCQKHILYLGLELLKPKAALDCS